MMRSDMHLEGPEGDSMALLHVLSCNFNMASR